MKQWKKWTMFAILVMGLVLPGCSDSDDPVAPPPPDTAPPAMPAGLVACPGCETVKLSWRPNTTDTDLAGYFVYRLAFGETWILTDEPVTEARFIDRAPLPGGATYAVAAVDVMGNESARLHFRYNYVDSDVEIDRP
jgi:hypothetical protein